MGMFDDLIPQTQKAAKAAPVRAAVPAVAGGMFDDLVPPVEVPTDGHPEAVGLPPPAPKQEDPKPAVFSETVQDWLNNAQQFIKDSPSSNNPAGATAAFLVGMGKGINQIPESLKMVGDLSKSSNVSMENTRLGISQKTNPNVYHGDGEYLRPMIGEVTSEDDGGLLYITGADGKVQPLDTETQVILKDPSDGKLKAFQRVPDWDESGLFGGSRLLTEGLVVNPLGGGAASATIKAAPGIPAAVRGTQRAQEAARDLQAFEEIGARPFGPAFNGPVGRTIAKQTSDTAVIGQPVLNALEESYAGVRGAIDRTADAISPLAEQDQVGSALQRGLTRFGTAGVDEVEPGQLQQLGVNPNAPVQAADVMSAQAAQRAQQAAPIQNQVGTNVQTTRGVQVPAAQSRNQTLTARRAAEDLSDDELNAVIRAPAQSTSFAARQEAMYERAFRLLPNFFRADGSRNPTMIAATNTRAALRGVDQNIASQITGGGRITGELAERIRNPQAGNFSLPQLRAMRTEIGRSLSNYGQFDSTLDRSQLRQLYGALSRDIEVGLIDLTNRAYLATRHSNNAANYISPEEARRAAGALRAFRTADRYTRQGMQRMDNFMAVVDAKTPEMAADRLVRAAREGGQGNIAMLRTARAALRPEEWAQVSAMVLRGLGRPVNSARGLVQEVGFSPQTFVTNWTKLGQRGRNLLFGAEHARAIENIFRASNRLANVEAMGNTSRSFTNAANMGMVMGGGGLAASGNWEYLLGSLASGGALSLIMSRPAYARWAAGYLRLRSNALNAPSQARISPQMVAQINRLNRMALQNPELRPIAQAVAVENGIPDQGEIEDGVGSQEAQ